MHKNVICLNGEWLADYLSDEPYTEREAPVLNAESDSLTALSVPGYWEDMLERMHGTALHTKLKWNPLYTRQAYPQAGYCPDMALPNPVGCLAYTRTFALTDNVDCGARELYIGGVQNRLSAWINGVYLGEHRGYSAEFSFDIPEGVLKIGENEIVFAVSNNRLSGYQGRPVSGLSSRAANECTGGVWGDVEIRLHPDGLRDAYVSINNDLSSFTVRVTGASEYEKQVSVYGADGALVKSAVIPGGEDSVTVSSEGMERWSVDSPTLYNLKVSTERESLQRRFGIKRLTVSGTRLYLNGEPYFFRGVCEHLYQPYTVHPTREKAYYVKLIKRLKSLGFNSVRFHTWVPMQEYMEAADEEGFIIEVETPNNTAYEEWREIVRACRRHISVSAFSSGNEMVIDKDYAEHLRKIADFVHTESDALMSPMSAMRGIEYAFTKEPTVSEPFMHNPEMLETVGEFSDIYNAYSLGLTSYTSLKGSSEILDYRNSIYKKPILTHEICIQGTYIDLALEKRYEGTRIGDTLFMSSVEKHLRDKGLLDRANLYYRNSSAWQGILRKHCFETVRMSDSFAGYDFLGDIDTHWHTFGYCVGMMNEFYELKPYETESRVLSYNSGAVLLCKLPDSVNFTEGEKISLPILVSNYEKRLENPTLRIRISVGNRVILRREIKLSEIPNGEITELYRLDFKLPEFSSPKKLTLSASLSESSLEIENAWEIYSFPKTSKKDISEAKRLCRERNITITNGMSMNELVKRLGRGESVVMFGTKPFKTKPVSFQISLAGRTTGHLATAIEEHPLMKNMPNDGYCSWQFRGMMSDAKAAVLDITRIPHRPIIDIASTYKNATREALLFEYCVAGGRLLVCTMNMDLGDAAAAWLEREILTYAASDAFSPKDTITLGELCSFAGEDEKIEINANAALNKNDVTMN